VVRAKPAPAAVAEPIQIGRYALYNVIAQGGMAAVHYGRQVGAIGFSRTVAIKRLQARYARDDAFVSMFVDEARVAARIQHPNVVATLDVVAEKDELFLVMEYLAGESLARLQERVQASGDRIPPAIVASILSGVLHGLHAAHEANAESGQPLTLVHRDVSPQNILVGADGTTRILDFGIAKATERMHETQDGTVKGKTAYIAPEQIRRGCVDRRTDVYSAAVVLWEALTGERLYEGPNEASVFEQVLMGLVDPPSARVPELPAAFDAIVSRGMNLRPDERYATAREMALDVERAILPALPSQVAEWVRATAGDALAQRASLVAEIEREHFIGSARSVAPQEALATTAPPTPRRRAPVVAAAVALGCVIAVTAWVGVRGRSHAEEAARPASPGPTAQRRSTGHTALSPTTLPG